jgi:hypothetical protein
VAHKITSHAGVDCEKTTKENPENLLTTITIKGKLGLKIIRLQLLL